MNNGRRLWDCLRRALDERRERLGLLARALGDPARAIEPLVQRLDEKTERLTLAWQGYFERRLGRLLEAAGKLRHPRDVLALAGQKFKHLEHSLRTGWEGLFLRKQHRLAALGPALDHLSPRNVLGRGYALVQDAAGHIVTSRMQLKRGDRARIEFQDGARNAVIEGD